MQKKTHDKNIVLILSYHSVSHTLFNSALHVDPVFSVTVEQLRSQFQIIRDMNIPVISLDAHESNESYSPLKIVLTFDDGHPSDYRFVFPMLQEFGFTAAFFICLRNIDSANRWKEYREISDGGNTIGSHGITHKYLTHLKAVDVKYEIEESSRIIRQKTHAACQYFAFPGGRYNNALLKLAKDACCKKVMTTDFGFNKINSGHFALKRWQIRRNTKSQEFREILEMNPFRIFIKQSRKYFVNAGKTFLGDNNFDHIRNIILRD